MAVACVEIFEYPVTENTTACYARIAFQTWLNEKLASGMRIQEILPLDTFFPDGFKWQPEVVGATVVFITD